MNKLSKLEQLLKETNTKQEFNIVEDLKSLALSYGAVSYTHLTLPTILRV